MNQVSVQAADVKEVIRAFSIEVAARDVDDLEEEPIVVRLRKVSGSVYLPLTLHSDSLSKGRWCKLRWCIDTRYYFFLLSLPPLEIWVHFFESLTGLTSASRLSWLSCTMIVEER